MLCACKGGPGCCMMGGSLYRIDWNDFEKNRDDLLKDVESIIKWLPKPDTSNGAPGPTGWLCPKCGRGNAPFKSTCPCVPIPMTVTC